MRKKSLFLILFAVLAMLTLSVSSSFAQNAGSPSADNDQLTALLLMLLQQQLQGTDETPELTATPTPTVTPEPTQTPLPDTTEQLMQQLIMLLQEQNSQTGSKPEITNTPTATPDTNELMVQLIGLLQQPQGNNGQFPAENQDPLPDGPESEGMKASIYENKKLIIEALPGYMFVRPTTGASESSKKPGETKEPEESVGPGATVEPMPTLKPMCVAVYDDCPIKEDVLHCIWHWECD